MSGAIYQCQDSIEPIADTLGEQWGNAALYSVVHPENGSCALTYSAAAMTVDLAAGATVHYGSLVTVTAAPAGFTLVSDPTNPRWTWLCLSSAGAAVVVSGDPAATPAVPELGDRVALALVYVQAGLTLATNATYKLDKRLATPGGSILVGSSNVSTSTVSTSAVDLLTISGLSIPVGYGFRLVFNFSKDASAAQAVYYGWKANATVIAEAAGGTFIARTSATQQAEDGVCTLVCTPRSSAAYLNGWQSQYVVRVSAGGASALNALSGAGTATIPNATITSIAIRAVNETSSNNGAVFSVKVYVDL